MKILIVHNFTWDSMPDKLTEASRITSLAPIEPVTFHALKRTYPPIQVKDGRITHAYFDEHLGDYARQHGYQGVFIVLNGYQRRILKVESGLRGAYQNDKDALMEGWIVADEWDEVVVRGIAINQFIKTLLHELGHGLCDWYGVADTVHTFDFKRERNDIASFYRSFKPKSALSYQVRLIAEALGVIKRRMRLSLPVPYFSWTEVTQPYLEANRALYPRSGVHPGTDFKGKAGDPLFAPIDGPVTRTGYTKQLGHWLEFKMGEKYLVALHLKDQPLVTAYKRGHQIGTLGNTGLQTGEHYHLEGWHKPMDRSLLTSAEAVRTHTFDIVEFIG